MLSKGSSPAASVFGGSASSGCVSAAEDITGMMGVTGSSSAFGVKTGVAEAGLEERKEGLPAGSAAGGFSEKPVASVAGDSARLPADNDLINGYSSSGKNVVLIVADMFSGGYMERIFQECPEYREKFSGFTWHRNMLAAATETATSMPSIFAGEEYLPLAMNSMPGSGDEKVNNAASTLFRQAEKQGYKVAVVNGSAA